MGTGKTRPNQYSPILLCEWSEFHLRKKPSNTSKLQAAAKTAPFPTEAGARPCPPGHVQGADTTTAASPTHPGRRETSCCTLCSTQSPCYKNSKLPGQTQAPLCSPRAHQLHTTGLLSATTAPTGQKGAESQSTGWDHCTGSGWATPLRTPLHFSTVE